MPARDIYHDTVKNALIKDGWTITQDPFQLQWNRKDKVADLSERLLAARNGTAEIAVAVQNFLGPSETADLEQAVGQYVLYRFLLGKREPSRVLYLAVADYVMDNVFDEPIGKLILQNHRIPLIVFDPRSGVVTQWIA
ncbi:MAG: XisH family protein [Planctomycetia bacterium]|nr:XisH family protein [Planctomycetia bacterium]